MKIDLTGMRFNHLSVIRKSDKQSNRTAYWECLCDCGNTTIVSTYALRGGHTKSCGCLKHRSNAKDLKGQRFGRLTVKRRIGTIGRRALWRCKCDCGKMTDVRSIDLISGNTKSCGCLHRHLAQKNFEQGGIYYEYGKEKGF